MQLYTNCTKRKRVQSINRAEGIAKSTNVVPQPKATMTKTNTTFAEVMAIKVMVGNLGNIMKLIKSKRIPISKLVA